MSSMNRSVALITSLVLGFQSPGFTQEEEKESIQILSIHNLLETTIPEVTFSNATLEEAVEFLRFRSSESDEGPEINFLIRPGAKDRVIEELTLRDSTLLEVLNAVCLKTKTTPVVDDYAVVLQPHPENPKEPELPARRWTVSPNFLEYLTPPAGQHLQLPVSKLLETFGVTFPKGSSASFLFRTRTLVVRNTDANLYLINNIIEASKDPEQAALDHKLVSGLILPEVTLSNATLAEVIDFFRLRSRDLDPTNRGINLNTFGDDKLPEIKVPDLSLKEVPLTVALKYVCDFSGVKMIQQGRHLSIFPKDS